MSPPRTEKAAPKSSLVFTSVKSKFDAKRRQHGLSTPEQSTLEKQGTLSKAFKT